MDGGTPVKCSQGTSPTPTPRGQLTPRTGYAAGGTPLEVTQKDFLVVFVQAECILTRNKENVAGFQFALVPRSLNELWIPRQVWVVDV